MVLWNVLVTIGLGPFPQASSFVSYHTNRLAWISMMDEYISRLVQYVNV